MVATITLTDNETDEAISGAGKTFTGVNIGTAAADRDLIIFVAATVASAVFWTAPTCTVAGNSATLLVANTGPLDASSNAPCVAIFRIRVTTGTTANIAVTTGPQASSAFDFQIAVYACTGLSGSDATVFDTEVADDTTLGGSTLTLSVDTAAGGIVVAGYKGYN